MTPATQDILLYQSPDGQIRLDVLLDHDTVWLTQAQMSELFSVSRPNVTMHLRNVFKENDLVADCCLSTRVLPRPQIQTD